MPAGLRQREPYPWHYLAALIVPQAAISLFARALLTGVTAPLPLLRLGYWDMQVIAAYAIVSMEVLAMVRQRPRRRLVMLSILAFIAGIHCGLLLVNVIAVSFLLTPLTYQWLLYADFFRSITPWQAVSSTISASGIAKLLLALILPGLCVAGIARVSRKGASWLAFLSLTCLALVIGGSLLLNFRDPPRRSPAGDMASSPVAVLVRTFMSSSASRLAALRGDGRTQDYRATEGSVKGTPSRDGHVAAPLTSVLIVVLESVSYEAVAQEMGNLPNLRRLAGQGAWFDNAFVTEAQSTRTIFSLAFSRFPLFSVTPETKSLLNAHLTPMTLPFRQHGGETKLFMGSDLAFENVRSLLDRQGYGPVADVSSIACGTRYVLSSGHLWTNGDYLPDGCVFDAAGKWMKSRSGRYLAVVWTGSTHFPYHAAGPAGDPHLRYRQALRDADRQIGGLVAALQASGRPLPSIIVMGDHGEAFGSHGYNGHGNSIHDDEIHIPLVIVAPGIRPGSRRTDLVSPVDIAPTVTELAGLPRPAGWQGASLVRPAARERLYAFALNYDPVIGVITKGSKYLYHLDQDGPVLRYDRTRDAGERRSIALDADRSQATLQSIAGWTGYNQALYRNQD